MDIEVARYLVYGFLTLALIYRAYDVFWGFTARAMRSGNQFSINVFHKWGKQLAEAGKYKGNIVFTTKAGNFKIFDSQNKAF